MYPKRDDKMPGKKMKSRKGSSLAFLIQNKEQEVKWKSLNKDEDGQRKDWQREVGAAAQGLEQQGCDPNLQALPRPQEC